MNVFSILPIGAAVSCQVDNTIFSLRRQDHVWRASVIQSGIEMDELSRSFPITDDGLRAARTYVHDLTYVYIAVDLDGKPAHTRAFIN